MKLKNLILSSIKEWPTLYRGWTYEDSRIPVLGSLFLTIGTGYEWHPDGFLAALNGRKSTYQIIKGKPHLPKDYFQKTLWCIDINKKSVAEVKKALGDKYHYIHRMTYGAEVDVVFESDEEFALEFTKRYDVTAKRRMEEGWGKFGFTIHVNEAANGYRTQFLKDHPDLIEYNPYPMCEYSPLVEMINKKTNSLHIDNFKLTNIRQDWIDGALEIAKYTLVYYQNPNRHKNCYYHPSRALTSFKELYDKDPVMFRKEREKDGMLPEHTIEQWCEIVWQRFLKEQIGYCEKFIEMYGDTKCK